MVRLKFRIYQPNTFSFVFYVVFTIQWVRFYYNFRTIIFQNVQKTKIVPMKRHKKIVINLQSDIV